MLTCFVHPFLCISLCIYTHRHAGLTWEVVHEAGLGSNDPLGSGLTEDGDAVFRPLTQRCQTTAQLGRCCEDFLIGEPEVLTQNHLQGERGEWWLVRRQRGIQKGTVNKGRKDECSKYAMF